MRYPSGHTHDEHDAGAAAWREARADVVAFICAIRAGARLTEDHGIRVITDTGSSGPEASCDALLYRDGRGDRRCVMPVDHAGPCRAMWPRTPKGEP